MHGVTLKRILLAPVNIFFDVTPLGKIMRIFTEDLNVFFGQILDVPKRMMDLVCSIFVSISLMFTIGGYEYVIPSIIVMFWLMHKLSVPFEKLDN